MLFLGHFMDLSAISRKHLDSAVYAVYTRGNLSVN